MGRIPLRDDFIVKDLHDLSGSPRPPSTSEHHCTLSSFKPSYFIFETIRFIFEIGGFNSEIARSLRWKVYPTKDRASKTIPSFR